MRVFCKTLTLVLLLCLLSLLTGCNKAKTDDTELSVFELYLSESTKKDIQDAYTTWYTTVYGRECEHTQWLWEDTNDGIIREDGGFRYYGTFGDCIVWYSGTEDLITAYFDMVGSGSFYAYIDGNHYGLQRAYQQGLISEEDLAIVAERHRVCEEDYRYYGTYGDCVIWFTDQITRETEEFKLANSVFFHKKGAMFHVTRNGTVITLEQAYRRGFLTADEIAAISQTHREHEPQPLELVLPLSDEMKEEIITSFMQWWQEATGNTITLTDWDSNSDSPESGYTNDGYRYYGTYNDCVVWFSASNATAITEFELAGFHFFHPVRASFFVYRNGEHYLLQQAYEQGFLSPADIAAISQLHETYNAAVKLRFS